MTLCIAALCTNLAVPHVGRREVVFCFDAQIETDVAKAETGFKFASISDEWVAMSSGANHLCSELLDLYREHLLKRPDRQNKAALTDYMREPPKQLRRRLAEQLVHARYAISYDDFMQHGIAWLGDEIHRQALYDISAQTINAQLILAGTHNGMDLTIYKVSGPEVTECDDFAVIGSGTMIAEPILYQRELQSYSPTNKATYIIYEAKRMAEAAPGVGKKTFMLRIRTRKNGVTFEAAKDSELAVLKSQFDRYGPRSIQDLPQDDIFLDLG